MRVSRAIALLLLLASAAPWAGAEDKDLLSLVADLGAVLEWNPLRDTGVIVSGEDRISLGVGIPMALVNYRVKVAIDPPVRRDGAVLITSDAVAALSDAILRDRLARASERLRVSHIMIDPGHGGKEPGSVGTYADSGRQATVKEKDVTLKVTRDLAALLKAAYPDKEILLTRRDDASVTLEKRAEMANELLENTKDTVLYISVHANSTLNTQSKAKGFEVWCLPPEFRRTVLDERSAGGNSKDILPILNSMREEEIFVESVMLAREILVALDAKLGALTENRGLRQESWYVVRNARMPAVLVEVGFMSSPEEAARLADDAYLKDVAEALYTGISSFITRFERDGSAGAR